jgi:large subunit ribosomal protein L1
MHRRGKKYQEAAKLVEVGKAYAPNDAVELVKKVSYTNFPGTVEMHLRMGLDPRHADQVVRGVALLPHGLGKQVRVLVFTSGEGIRLAEAAGADYVGADELIKRVEEGWLEFDVAIATPEVMANKVSRLGRVLGRKGLMPNPRSGTIVQPTDLARAVRDARQGRVEFRLDKTGIIHVPVGKANFEDKALLENIASIIDSVQKAKPAGAKGQYVHTITLAPSMGPGVPLDLTQALSMKVA